jgi:hypothetical protein
MTMNNDDMDNDDNQQSTHPHTDKQLLIRWIAGAPGLYDNKDNKQLRGRQMTNNWKTTNNWGQ